MYFRRNLSGELGVFRFQIKSIKNVFAFPLVVLYILIPAILILTMRKYQDIYYVEENLMLLGQYLVPVLSIWWLCFAFIEFVEGEGNELYFVNSRMKDNLVLLWLGLYLLVVGVGCAAVGFWVNTAWLEFIRMAISSCFYVGMVYAVMFISGSMTISFLVVMLYWMASVFGEQIPFEWLNCYDTNFMSLELLSEKYAYIMFFSVLFYLLGSIANLKKQKFN